MNFNIIKIIYKKLERAVFKNADYCHAVSNYLAGHINQYGVNEVVMIPNGVNSEQFQPDLNKKDTRKKLGFETKNLIVCVSRLEHKNGTHDLIKAIDFLGNLDLKLIICGNGSERKTLESMASDLNFKDRIFFLGDVSYNDLPKYVACADIFVRPSLAEGFGIVFLEAMAAGVAIIGTPIGGITDFLRDNETGLFCESGNPKDIAEKIKILIRDKALVQKLTQNGLKTIKDEYNWDIISQKIKDLYSEIIINKK